MCDKLLCVWRNPVAAAKAVPSPPGRNSSDKRGTFYATNFEKGL